MSSLPLTRVVLYKHGVGYFEREGTVEGDATLSLTFKQAEVSDVLKSLTVLDLDGGHIASVSYDSTKPLEQLLAEVALSIPDEDSLVGLLPQIKGARVGRCTPASAEPSRACILGIDTTERQTGDGIVKIVLLSLLTDDGEVRSFDLHGLAGAADPRRRPAPRPGFLPARRSSRPRRRTRAPSRSSPRAQGERTHPPQLHAGGPGVEGDLPHHPGRGRPAADDPGLGRRRQHAGRGLGERAAVADRGAAGVVRPRPVHAALHPPAGGGCRRRRACCRRRWRKGWRMAADATLDEAAAGRPHAQAPWPRANGCEAGDRRRRGRDGSRCRGRPSAPRPAQVRERKLGDLFEYEIEHPVTIRRNQSALVPIVLRAFEGRPVLLYNKQTRAENPMRCVEFKNTTGLTLEGGPVTVLEGGSYVGEAMLETLKPDEQRLVPYAVELGVHVLDNVDSHERARCTASSSATGS